MRRRGAPASLGDYSARADWPAGYAGRRSLPEASNWGLLLRWEAALHEMAAFRSLPPAAVEAFLGEFGAAVEARIAASPELERIAAPPAGRAAGGWDAHPTIFPLLVHGPGGPLEAAAVQALYERLRSGDGTERLALGQPVHVGVRNGQPVSALRLAIGAREVVAALRTANGRQTVTDRAVGALAAIARAARDFA
jgi:hypothetical protein